MYAILLPLTVANVFCRYGFAEIGMPRSWFRLCDGLVGEPVVTAAP
jgi:hypothetical protein